MADLVSLPCNRCGKPASIPVGAPASSALCERCRSISARYVVQAGSSSREYDAEALLTAIQKGEITALDWVGRVGETPRPIAGHPDFRVYFMPGVDLGGPRTAPDAVKKAINWLGIFRFVGGAVVLGAIAGGAWLWYQAGPSIGEVGEAVRARVAPVLPGNGAVAPVQDRIERIDPRSQPKILGLIDQVGPVEEPRAMLMAQAWSARTSLAPDRAERALAAAERAVARAPESPETLALLAEILAEQGGDPALRASLIQVSRSLQPEGIAWRRAAAADALANGKPTDALEHVTACLSAVPEDLPCRYLEAQLIASDDPARALAGLDALAKDWPDNPRVDRDGAVLAAEVDSVDAVARVERARSRVKGDAELEGATALLRFRDGAVTPARGLAAKLGERATGELAVTAGEAAIAAGAPADALKWVQRAERGRLSPRQIDRVRLVAAQAAWMLARQDQAKLPQAQEAAEALRKVDGSSPASVQVQALIAGFGGGVAGDLWSGVETKKADPVDVERMWLSRASLALGRGDIKDALTSAEQARNATPTLPDAWLWSAQASAVGKDPARAVETLRRAILAIDGRAARRNPVGGALAIPPDAEVVRAALMAGPGLPAPGVAFGRAVAAVLGGDGAAALTDYPSPLPADGAAGIALVARARLLRGDKEGALAELAKATPAMEKEPALAALRLEAGLTGAAASKAVALLLGSSPGDAYYQALKAEAARRAGDTATARLAAEAASRANPRDSEARRLYRALVSSGA